MNVCFMPGFISGAKKKNDRKIRHGPGHRRENLTCKNVMPSCRNFDRRIYKVKKGVQFNLYQCLLSFEAVLQKPTSSEWRVSLSGPEEAGFAPRLKSGLCWGNSIPGLQMAAFPLCPFRPQRESKLSLPIFLYAHWFQHQGHTFTTPPNSSCFPKAPFSNTIT